MAVEVSACTKSASTAAISWPQTSGLTSISRDEIGEVGGEHRKAADREREAVDVHRRRAAIAVEQAAQRKAVEQTSRRGGPERRERGAPIGQELDQHAARADGDERAELRIAHHARARFPRPCGIMRATIARGPRRAVEVAPRARAPPPRRRDRDARRHVRSCAGCPASRSSARPDSRGAPPRRRPRLRSSTTRCATTGTSYAASSARPRRFIERAGGAELARPADGVARRARCATAGSGSTGRARKSRCASAPRTATSPLQVPSSTGTPASVKRSAIASWRSCV